MLRVKNVSVDFGKAKILRDVSISVEKSEIVSIVGANGAGKSTLLNTISRFTTQRSGTIRFNDESIDNRSYDAIVKMGLVQVPEGRMVFPSLTVLENLELGAFHNRLRRNRDVMLKDVYGIFPILEARKNQPAGTLSGGEQQMLAIGRGLMSSPELLMLDEPSQGLAPLIVSLMFHTIVTINEQGVTILVVEQNVMKTLSISIRGYVFENGQISLEGMAGRLLENEEIKTAFLGL